MASTVEGANLDRVHAMFRSAEEKNNSSSIPRTKPMKVLCLGMGRTGTTSLAAALKALGYTPYDFIDRFMLQHIVLWNQALEAKFVDSGVPWGKAEFDRVTSDFDALLDIPCCLFVEELTNAYPDAKVILNVRNDADKWLVSMKNTLFTVFDWPSWKILQYTEPKLCGGWYRHVNLIREHALCDKDGDEACKQKYLDHNEHVRRSVPPDQLLEWQVTEGWEPLCRFLDQPVPSTDFPAGNAPQEFIDAHAKLWRVAIYMSVRNAGRLLLPVAVALSLAWAWRRWSS